MVNEIFNVVAPIAKTFIEGYINSAIMDDYSPKKTDNPFTGQEIIRSVIRNYNTLSQIDPNRENNSTDQSLSIRYNGNNLNFTTNQQEKENPYTLAMKKQYMYNF